MLTNFLEMEKIHDQNDNNLRDYTL